MMRIVSMFAVLVTVVTSGRALAAENVLAMQQMLEGRIRPVVQEIDPKAHVYVTLKTKQVEMELPLTPFVYKDYVLEDANGQVQVQRLEVMILASSGKEFPASMKKLIRELTGVFGPITQTTIRQLPTDFARVSDMKATASAERAFASVDDSAWTSFWNMFHSHGWHLALVLLGALMVVGCFLAAGSIRHGTESIEYAVKGGVDRLLIAADKHVPELAAGRDTADHEDKANVIAYDPAFWAQISDDAFAAMLADCYWGEFDSYASFLWKRVPLSRRKNLLSRHDFLSDYASHLTWVREDDYNHEQEPYYLAPLSIGHLCNHALTDLVRNQPTLLMRLSALRLAGLQVDPKERVELTKAALGRSAATLPDFALMPGSPRRSLARTTPMAFKSEAEESELISLGNVSPEVFESVPSLGWLARLGDVEIGTILGRFSARELAGAWVGPEAVLSRLAQQLPPKKLRLVQSYRRRYGASRQSPVFLRLHRMAADQLRSRMGSGMGDAAMRMAA